jgi:CRP-like cAMP-binding protein
MEVGTILKLSVFRTWLGLPEKLVSELFGRATPHHLKAGDTLFQIGDVGDGCYRLDKGVLKVSLTSPQAEERILAFLASGAIVGDLAMIDALPRSASVVAVTDCELRFISRSAFVTLLDSTQKSIDIYRQCWPLACGKPTKPSHPWLS